MPRYFTNKSKLDIQLFVQINGNMDLNKLQDCCKYKVRYNKLDNTVDNIVDNNSNHHRQYKL
jgi:hypothetical protein